MRPDGNSEERRAVPRFPLPKERVKVFFDTREKVFSVRDLSAHGLGIGLAESSEGQYFTVGATIRCELKLGKEALPLRVIVRRIGPWSVGCEFADATSELSSRIESVLNPLRIAKSLQAVKLDAGPEAFAAGISAWYHGDSATDLYLWHDVRGGVSRVLLCMNGRFWEWADRQRSRTGSFERKSPEKAEFTYDSSPDPVMRSLAAKVLEHQEVLDYRLVNFLKEQV